MKIFRFVLVLLCLGCITQARAQIVLPPATATLTVQYDSVEHQELIEIDILLVDSATEVLHIQLGCVSGASDLFDYPLRLIDLDYGPVHAFMRSGNQLTIQIMTMGATDAYLKVWVEDINGNTSVPLTTSATY